jgi:hypothetical protein
MTKCQRGLNTDFAANSLGFSTPTHMHESSNYINGYGHPKTTIAQSISGTAGNQFRSNGLESRNGFGLWRGLKFSSLLVGYLMESDIMTCTHDLIILTKTKEATRYRGSHTFGGKSALNKCFYHFNMS